MRRSETFSRTSVTGRRSSVGQRLLSQDEESRAGLSNLVEGNDSEEELEMQVGSRGVSHSSNRR